MPMKLKFHADGILDITFLPDKGESYIIFITLHAFY